MCCRFNLTSVDGLLPASCHASLMHARWRGLLQLGCSHGAVLSRIQSCDTVARDYVVRATERVKVLGTPACMYFCVQVGCVGKRSVLEAR